MEWSLELEEYITAHSEQESEVLAALRRATHLNVMRPRMLSGNMQGQLLNVLPDDRSEAGFGNRYIYRLCGNFFSRRT